MALVGPERTTMISYGKYLNDHTNNDYITVFIFQMLFCVKMTHKNLNKRKNC